MFQVAIGEPGDLYIGGSGLAKGYLNRPELTSERFIHISSVMRLVAYPVPVPGAHVTLSSLGNNKFSSYSLAPTAETGKIEPAH
jgi:acyl-CoA synthetase (AMP-forming)/AMP-acid ligase II